MINLDATTISLIGFVVLLIGVSKSGFAGALGVLSVPLLMLKIPAPQAIALILPLLIIADTMTLKGYWKKWETPLLWSILPGAVLGIIIATLVIGIINEQYLRFIIAIFCIVFALYNLLLKQKKLALIDNKFGAVLMSTLSGLSSTLVHAGGPPIIAYFTAINLSPSKFVASAAVFFALMNLIKVVSFVSVGLLNWSIVFTAVAFIPLAFVGHVIGMKLNQRLNKDRFMSVMNYLLLLLGLWLCVMD